jgi:hypothetical protein
MPAGPQLQVAYADPDVTAWLHTAPAGAQVELIHDDGPHVARVWGAGFEPYKLTRAGEVETCP